MRLFPALFGAALGALAAPRAASAAADPQFDLVYHSGKQPNLEKVRAALAAKANRLPVVRRLLKAGESERTVFSPRLTHQGLVSLR